MHSFCPQWAAISSWPPGQSVWPSHTLLYGMQLLSPQSNCCGSHPCARKTSVMSTIAKSIKYDSQLFFFVHFPTYYNRFRRCHQDNRVGRSKRNWLECTTCLCTGIHLFHKSTALHPRHMDNPDLNRTHLCCWYICHHSCIGIGFPHIAAAFSLYNSETF